VSIGARVDSASPRRLVAAVRRFVADSERAALSAVTAMEVEVAATQHEVAARERQLGGARQRLAQAEAALARCRSRPNANCAGFAHEVAEADAQVKKHVSRVRAGREVLAEMHREHARLVTARRRLVADQTRNAEGAQRELARAGAQLDAYLAGASVATSRSATSTRATASHQRESASHAAATPTGNSPAVTFSSDTVARCWSLGLSTPAGRAYYGSSDHTMRELASTLKPSRGEYTVDMHGTSTSVSVEGQPLDAAQLAELVRADSRWDGRPVRLFSCNTGQDERTIAAELARNLNVKVTAPRSLAWSNRAGDSWVAPYEWKMVNGVLQRLGGSPLADGWQRFDP
jgi:hypothetical protein